MLKKRFDWIYLNTEKSSVLMPLLLQPDFCGLYILYISIFDYKNSFLEGKIEDDGSHSFGCKLCYSDWKTNRTFKFEELLEKDISLLEFLNSRNEVDIEERAF